MVNNEILRQKVADLQAKGKADREWWDRERASIQSKFMKELDEGSGTGTGSGASKPSTTPAEKGGSDEDAVLVEGGGPAASGSAASSKGGTKKRKGKK